MPLGATGGVPAVVAGHVAAAVAPPPWAFSPSQSGLQILINLKQEMPKVIMDSVVFSNAFIKAHPQAANELTKAVDICKSKRHHLDA